MIATLRAANATFIVARWFLMCGSAMNYFIESKTLRKRYLVSYYNSLQNMRMMVYESDTISMVNIRMNINAFKRLCEILETRGGLSSSKNIQVDEQVAMFLHILADNKKKRIIVNKFQRSGETISRYFKLVLNAVCRLHKEFYKTPVPVPNNELDERSKWFKGYLGALDGTYVKVRVPEIERKPYRTRKVEICTNVLSVCTRDLQFIYVLAGWEGSAADSRVLREKCVLTAPDDVWAAYLKDKKQAAPFKNKAQPYYEKLCTIFGKDRATGAWADDLGDDEIVQDTPPISPIDVDMDVPVSSGVGNKRKRSKTIEFSVTFKECSIDLCDKLEDSICKLGDKIVASANQDIPTDILDEEVITSIQGLPHITPKQHIRGMHIIGRNASKARIFLKSP